MLGLESASIGNQTTQPPPPPQHTHQAHYHTQIAFDNVFLLGFEGEGGHQKGYVERPGSSSEPEQRMSQTIVRVTSWTLSLV